MIKNSSYRNSASFGKRIEYNLIGRMLMDGLDVYVPLVDDHGVDCIVKNKRGFWHKGGYYASPLMYFYN